jgi:hypothetical protein
MISPSAWGTKSCCGGGDSENFHVLFFYFWLALGREGFRRRRPLSYATQKGGGKHDWSGNHESKDYCDDNDACTPYYT